MLRKISNFFTRIVSQFLPDPFLLAILISFIVLIAGVVNSNSPFAMIHYFGKGFFSLNSFTMQMVLVLVTGHILANTPVSHRVLFFFVQRKIPVEDSAGTNRIIRRARSRCVTYLQRGRDLRCILIVLNHYNVFLNVYVYEINSPMLSVRYTIAFAELRGTTFTHTCCLSLEKTAHRTKKVSSSR